MELVGKVLGNRYEVLERVGVGGMATVYKAKDKTLGRNVAVKVLKDEFANDQEFIKRFQIEAQSAASLSHPNIVSIYDVSHEDDIHYIVMELIEGKTLKEIISSEGSLDWKKSVEIASQIASGLSTAHKNHIIHRDIKPHNIIITKEGIAKITDFGIAKAASSSTINAKSSSLGSVHYFSPEHARGGYTDEKSDIYSLGVVLYEMCTGKLPFDGDSAVSIAMKHLKEEPTDAKTLEPSIPEGLNSIIKKAMEKEVSSRYLSASEMYKDLQKVLRDPTTLNVGANGEQLFTTQRVTPISSTSSINSSTINQKKNVGGKMNEKDTVKKKNNKKKYNPIVVALIRLILAALIFAAAVGAGYYLFEKLMEPEDSGTVPGVIGYDQATAEKILQNAGFKMDVNGVVESDLPKEYVAKQRYASGEKLSKGTTVTVSLSAGPKRVKVPTVVGDSVIAAQAKLKMYNLGIVIEEEESEEVEQDKIIRQEPTANTEADTGTSVTVYVSKGPHDERVYMPDLSTYDEAQALSILKELGLEVEVNYIESKEFPDGKIVSQSFEPETKVEEGTVIVLVINRLTKEEENPEETTPAEPTPTPSVAPTSTPAPTPAPTPEPEVVPDKILKINVKGKGAQKTFKVKVTLNGDIKGRTAIYEGTHNRDEGIIEVPYPGDATGMIRVYIDDKLDSEMLVG